MADSAAMSAPGGAALAWAAAAVAGAIGRVEPLGVMGASWLLHVAGCRPLYLRLGNPRDAAMRRRFRSEAAALALTERTDVPAPRLVAADLTGAAFGRLALLRTVLPGISRFPREPSRGRLRALGAAAAALASVTVPADADLPARTGPIADAEFAPASVRGGPASRLREAAHRVAGWQDRSGERVLVHGDLWQGNTLWRGDCLSGIVDWDYAGAGPAGIDLGYLRLDAAFGYGLAAVEAVLDGWERARGRPAREVSVWDVVAAVATPPDLGEWVAAWHDQGRTDLDVPILTRRRDEFLRAALRDLGWGR
jgi:aminoglycoside phosphotransferase (APT) family kinase protein